MKLLRRRRNSSVLSSYINDHITAFQILSSRPILISTVQRESGIHDENAANKVKPSQSFFFSNSTYCRPKDGRSPSSIGCLHLHHLLPHPHHWALPLFFKVCPNQLTNAAGKKRINYIMTREKNLNIHSIIFTIFGISTYFQHSNTTASLCHAMRESVQMQSHAMCMQAFSNINF